MSFMYCRQLHATWNATRNNIRRTAAAKNLHKALEPLGDAMPIFIKGCDWKHMWLRELRSALDWLESTDGPSPKFDAAKYCAALFAYRPVNEFSQKPPSTTIGGQVREIGALLYLAFSGEEADLKRQTDAVCTAATTMRFRNVRADSYRESCTRLILTKLGRPPAAPGQNDSQALGR